MVVGVRIGDSRLHVRVLVHAGRYRLVNIQRVVVEQRDDARYLRNYKECQQRCAKPADCSHERNGLAICSALILKRDQRIRLRQICHTVKLFQLPIRPHVSVPTDRFDRQFRFGWSGGRSRTGD
jgi:hypothetical protein